jgi:hypothetical protein
MYEENYVVNIKVKFFTLIYELATWNSNLLKQEYTEKICRS